MSRHPSSASTVATVLLLPGMFAAYTSEPAWLCAGTMTATAPMRVNVDELICGDDVSGGGICG